jgi:hypothetical protein
LVYALLLPRNKFDLYLKGAIVSIAMRIEWS